jgi:hypothetical protein
MQFQQLSGRKGPASFGLVVGRNQWGDVDQLSRIALDQQGPPRLAFSGPAEHLGEVGEEADCLPMSAAVHDCSDQRRIRIDLRGDNFGGSKIISFVAVRRCGFFSGLTSSLPL